MDAAVEDRLVGAVTASAVGDALGAPYEFVPPLRPDQPVVMAASNLWEVGEWTDDTSMQMPILLTAQKTPLIVDGAPSDEALGEVFRGWMDWALATKDIGLQTSAVMRLARSRILPGHTGREVTSRAVSAAERVFERTDGEGNGSLMRTGIVPVLAHGASAGEIAELAAAISRLTHVGEDSVESCVIWSLAVDHAVRTGELSLEPGLTQLSDDSRAKWEQRLSENAHRQPWDFTDGAGWSVTCFLAAWSSVRDAHSLPEALERAVRSGGDTDTVAAVTGALAGARWGHSAIPEEWASVVHGYPGVTLDEMAVLVRRAVSPQADGRERRRRLLRRRP